MSERFVVPLAFDASYHNRLFPLAVKMLDCGGSLIPRERTYKGVCPEVVADFSGQCERPFLMGDYSSVAAIAANRPTNPLELRYWVRCRKCAWCLNMRSHRWAQRALVETESASRTWFLTLTVEPYWVYLVIQDILLLMIVVPSIR